MQIHKDKKKRLWQPKTFSHIKFSPAHHSHGRWPGQEGACKARSGLLQPHDGGGEGSLSWKEKTMAVRKGGKWWLRAEKERGSLGMEKDWGKNMNCEGDKGWGQRGHGMRGYLGREGEGLIARPAIQTLHNPRLYLALPLISSGCGGNVLCPHLLERSTCPLLQAAICVFSWFYKATGHLHTAMSFLLTSTNTRK